MNSRGYRYRASDPLLNATVDPLSAHLIVTSCSAQLEAEARRLLGATSPGNRRAGELLLATVGQLRRAARQVADVSAPGSAEVPTGPDSSGWGCPPGTGLTAGEVAPELGCTARQVRNLCVSGSLRGELRGGQWLIDPTSVDEEKRRRSQDAD